MTEISNEARDAAYEEVRERNCREMYPDANPPNKPEGHFVQRAINTAVSACNTNWLNNLKTFGLDFDADGKLVNTALEASAKREAELREALERILRCDDAPSIDISGEAQFGLHCGVEDRDCADRYQGADYGYSRGMEAGLEWAVNESKAALARYQKLANTEVGASGHDNQKPK